MWWKWALKKAWILIPWRLCSCLNIVISNLTFLCKKNLIYRLIYRNGSFTSSLPPKKRTHLHCANVRGMENLTIRENDENSRIPSWIYHFYDNEEAIYYDMSTAAYSYRVFHLIFNTLLCLRWRRDIWVSSLSVRVNGSANEKRKKLKSFTEMKHAKVPPQIFFVNSSEYERLSLNTIFQFSRQSRNFL